MLAEVSNSVLLTQSLAITIIMKNSKHSTEKYKMDGQKRKSSPEKFKVRVMLCDERHKEKWNKESAMRST